MLEILDTINSLPSKPIPVVTPENIGFRRDRVFSSREEAFLSMRNEEAIKGLGSNGDRDDTFATHVAASHTNVKMEHPDSPEKQIPAHLLTWMANKNTDIYLYSLPPEDYENLAASVTRNVSYIVSKTGEKPVIYQLFGYSSPESKTEEGTSTGGASNEHFHIHAAVPPEVNEESATTANPEKKYKYYAPVSQAFSDVWPELVESLLSKREGITVELTEEETELVDYQGAAGSFSRVKDVEIYDGRAKSQEYHDSNNELAIGSNISIESTKLEDYLKALYVLEGRLNEVYQVVKDAMAASYLENQEGFSQTRFYAIKKLERLGLSPDLAEKIYKKGELFKPTLRQVDNWLGISVISDEKRDRLEKIRESYLKNKKRIEDPNFRKRLMRRYGYEKAEIILSIFRNQYLDESEGEPKFTLSENFSMKYLITDYELDDGKLIVHSASVVPLMMSVGGNTVENVSGAVIDRL